MLYNTHLNWEIATTGGSMKGDQRTLVGQLSPAFAETGRPYKANQTCQYVAA